MKTLAQALAMLVAPLALASAQTGPDGRWQAQGAPWTIELKTGPGGLTGTVAQQNSIGTEISEGRVDGNTITFTVKVASGGVITFTGRITGDEIVFEREAKFPGAPGQGEFGLFGPGEPTAFTVNRVSAAWTGTIRNAPTRRNPTPNPNPRAVTLGVKKMAAPHWRWRGGDKEMEVQTFTLPMGSFELSSFTLEGDRLSYVFSRPNQGDQIRCDLARQPEGKFTGRCEADGGGFQVLIELAPPASPPGKQRP